MQVAVLLPAAAGVIATLLGVGLGGVLTRRQQTEAWARDRQIDACASIVNESTRMQLQLGRVASGIDTALDWVPWNSSLAVLHLVGHPEIVASAQAMDEAFWISGDAIKHRDEGAYPGWNALREPLEATRLAFVNTSRRHLLVDDRPLSRLVARVPSIEMKYQRTHLPSGASAASNEAPS